MQLFPFLERGSVKSQLRTWWLRGLLIPNPPILLAAPLSFPSPPGLANPSCPFRSHFKPACLHHLHFRSISNLYSLTLSSPCCSVFTWIPCVVGRTTVLSCGREGVTASPSLACLRPRPHLYVGHIVGAEEHLLTEVKKKKATEFFIHMGS